MKTASLSVSKRLVAVLCVLVLDPFMFELGLGYETFACTCWRSGFLVQSFLHCLLVSLPGVVESWIGTHWSFLVSKVSTEET